MMTRAFNIHVSGGKRNKPAAAMAAALLLPLAITLTVPRECFDPHPEIGYDIYCRLYFGVAAQETAGAVFTLFFSRLTVETVIENTFIALSSPFTVARSIRAPPPAS